MRWAMGLLLLLCAGFAAAYVRYQYPAKTDLHEFIHQDNTDSEWVELCLIGRDLQPTNKTPEQDEQDCRVQVKRVKAKLEAAKHE